MTQTAMVCTLACSSFNEDTVLMGAQTMYITLRGMRLLEPDTVSSEHEPVERHPCEMWPSIKRQEKQAWQLLYMTLSISPISL